MDGADQDFGSGGVALLDPTVFKGTGVNSMAITSGKNGKIYVMNTNHLGGYKQGPGQTDLVLQEIVTSKAVFGGVGSYPLEGGYIYSIPVGYPVTAYKLSLTSSGVPQFVQAGVTPEGSAGRVGAGIPTITTNKGQAGTAIMWTTDPDAGLRAWYAVPQSDGTFKRIKSIPQTAGSVKFQRPAFGDGRVYTTDSNGFLYCLGSPVNLPLNCTSPVSFGDVALGSKKSTTVNCTAVIGITQLSSVTISDLNFKVDQTTIPSGTIAKGTTFSLGVTWDLSNVTVSNAVNASYGNTTPGIKSAALTIVTVNSVGGYTTSFPVGLTGNQVSKKPFLAVTPPTVDFGGLVLGVSGSNAVSTLSFTIANLGANDMTILGYAFDTDADDDHDAGGDETPLTNATADGNGVWNLGPGFTTNFLPAPKSVIPAGSSQSISATFTPIDVGGYLSYFFVYSTGGNVEIILEGSASTAAVATIDVSTSEGGWTSYADGVVLNMGQVAPGGFSTGQIRICNKGGSVLQITKSKPPLGDIRATSYGIDLHESQQIAVSSCAYGNLTFGPGPAPPNQPDVYESNIWTLNTNDLSFGVQEVKIVGVVHDTQVGPLYSNGTAKYQYLGCYLDSNNARLLPNQYYNDPKNNTIQECTNAGAAKNAVFVGLGKFIYLIYDLTNMCRIFSRMLGWSKSTTTISA